MCFYQLEKLFFCPSHFWKTCQTRISGRFPTHANVLKGWSAVISLVLMARGAAKAESMRGSAAGRWPVAMIVESGFALATACCGNIDPDYHDGWKNGVHPLFTEGDPKPDEWGTISAWAWGLSRLLDALEEIKEVEARRVAVIGHSRLGKTSLWAGATDPRFQVVISNNSGCGGADELKPFRRSSEESLISS